MRKLVSLVLAVVLLAGAAWLPTARATDDEKVLRVVLGMPGDTFDPQYNSGASASMYMAQMMEGLFLYDPDGVLVYGMAESHTVSDDQLTWTFTLRDGLKWSDGQDLTAQDFVFSFQRLVTPELDASNGWDMGGFFKNGLESMNGKVDPSEVGVSAPDEKTLVIELAAPCPFFDDILCGSTFFPVRSDVCDNTSEGKWSQNVEKVIVNGPYKMVEYDYDTGFRLERNEYYYDSSRQIPDAIECVFVTDENSAIAAFTVGDVDFSMMAPAEEVPRLTDEGMYHQMPRLGTYYLMPNLEAEPFDDVLVRKAFAYSVDTAYIAEVVLNNRFLPAKSFIGPGFMGSTAGVDFVDEAEPLLDRTDFQASAEKAREYLAEAGYPNGEGFPVVEYVFNDTVDNRAMAESLQSFWQTELNVSVSITPIENTALNEMRNQGAFELTRQGWLADYNDALGMLNIFTTDSGINAGKYSSEAFDELFFKAQVTADRAERMALLHEAETILIEDMGCIPLFHYMFGFVYNPEKVEGIYTAPAGQLYLTKATVK